VETSFNLAFIPREILFQKLAVSIDLRMRAENIEIILEKSQILFSFFSPQEKSFSSYRIERGSFCDSIGRSE